MKRTFNNKLHFLAWLWFVAILATALLGCGGSNYSGSGAYTSSAAGQSSDQASYTIVLGQYNQYDSSMQAQTFSM